MPNAMKTQAFAQTPGKNKFQKTVPIASVVVQ